MSAPVAVLPSRRRAIAALAVAGGVLVAVGQLFTLVHLRPLSDGWYSFVWFGFILAADAVVARRTGASLILDRTADLAFMLVASTVVWWGFELANVKLMASWSYSPSPDVSLTAQRLRSSLAFSSLVPAVWQAGLLTAALWPRRRAPAMATGGAPIRRSVAVALAAAGVALLGAAVALPVLSLPLGLLGVFLLADATNALRARPSLLARALGRDVHFATRLVVGNLAAGLVGEAWNYPADPRWTYDVPYADVLHVFEMPLPGYLGYGALALALFAIVHAVRPAFRVRPLPPGHPLVESGLG